MSITLWILFSFTLVFTILYTVCFLRKTLLISNIASIFILPLLGTSNLLLLINFLPDSFHTIVVTSIAYFAIIAAQILLIFEKHHRITVLSRLFFLVSTLTWIHLYFSAFYIYKVSTVLILSITVLLLLLCIAICIICGKQKLNTYLYSIIGIFSTGFLCMLGFIFLVYGKTTSAILLFTGTLVNIALVTFYTIDNSKFNFKYGHLIRFFLLICAQVLISYSNVLMLR